MSESRAETVQAFGLALLLHALLFVVLVAGLPWTRKAERASAPGSMSVELVDASALSSAMQRALGIRPEPGGEVLPEPERAAQRMPVEATEADVQKAELLQEQVDLTERGRHLEAKHKQQLSQIGAEREKQLDEIRKLLTAAPSEAHLVEHKLEQIAEAGPASEDFARADADESAGKTVVDSGLAAQYAAALQAAIEAKWTRPDSISADTVCPLIIHQLQGGEVMDVQVSSTCSYDEQGRRSIEAAVLKAQPLPYQGFEAAFQRNLTLNFQAEDR